MVRSELEEFMRRSKKVTSFGYVVPPFEQVTGSPLFYFIVLKDGHRHC